MPSSLHQKIYLGGLPDGITMTIEDVVPSRPDNQDWFASFTRYDVGSISIWGDKKNNYITFPFTVSKSIIDGLIGDIKFDGYSGLYSTGTGPKVDITFRLKGTTTVNGTPITVNEKGYISISSSEWKGFERPDYSNVTYFWGDTAPINLSISVPSSIAGMPDDAFFIFGVNAEKKEIGVNTTTHKEIIDTALDYAIKGIFWVNEKLAGWALGALSPF